MEIKVDISDYMGKIEGGVLVMLTVNCGGDFTEGTIFYTERDMVLTVDPSVEEKIGCVIEEWAGYEGLIRSILGRLIPASEIIDRLDDVNLDLYVDSVDAKYVDGEIDPSEIIAATQSNL